MVIFCEEEVKKCLDEITDCDDKTYALELLEWAINKRSINLEEHDRLLREDVIDECKRKVKEYWLNSTVAARIVEDIHQSLDELKGEDHENLS